MDQPKSFPLKKVIMITAVVILTIILASIFFGKKNTKTQETMAEPTQIMEPTSTPLPTHLPPVHNGQGHW